MLAKHCNGATEQGHLNRTKPQQLTKQSRRTVQGGTPYGRKICFGVLKTFSFLQ